MLADNEHDSLWRRLRKWSARHGRLIVIIIVPLVIASITVFYLVLLRKPDTKPVANHTTTVKKVKEVIKYYSPLTGKEIPSESDATLPVTAAMIENSPSARPQSGLKQAGIVFEAIAEGGITRFMALYQEDKPSVIGPVRSIRLYDVEWAAAFNTSIAHVGGSAGALREVRNGSYRDLDQFFNSRYYWRAANRPAPHNVYTSYDKLSALNKAKGYTSSTFTGFSRTDGKASSSPDAATINIKISSATYNSYYIYDKTNNNYARYQAGAAHTDREDGQITPSVVVAIYVKESTVLQDGYREVITTNGSGKAIIFQNGTATEGTWQKTSKSSQMAFSDAAGNPISLVRGQTWITALPNDGRGKATWQS